MLLDSIEPCSFFFFFFFNDTATTEIYTLSLHDALPIYQRAAAVRALLFGQLRQVVYVVNQPLDVDRRERLRERPPEVLDRKSTRLNSSHGYISYAVFCLKKKKKKTERSMSMNVVRALIS